MTDRVKETLFNILGHRYGLPGELPPFDVLDLFAGSGGLGIEAISRGARSCLFVERDRSALRVLRENLKRLGIEPACRVVAENVWTMRFEPPTPEAYGIAFVDPPYADTQAAQHVIDLLERLGPALGPEGVALFRRPLRTAVPLETLRSLTVDDERDYGDMRISFLIRRGSSA